MLALPLFVSQLSLGGHIFRISLIIWSQFQDRNIRQGSCRLRKLPGAQCGYPINSDSRLIWLSFNFGCPLHLSVHTLWLSTRLGCLHTLAVLSVWLFSLDTTTLSYARINVTLSEVEIILCIKTLVSLVSKRSTIKKNLLDLRQSLNTKS
jgi:hypothetical protein